MSRQKMRFDEDNILKELLQATFGKGACKALARKANVPIHTIYACRARDIHVPDKVARALGYMQVCVYLPLVLATAEDADAK